MKTTAVYFLFICLLTISLYSSGQVTSPVIRANFGVDADLRANFFNSFIQAGNDDWFLNNAGPGNFIIDTTGASYLLNQYNVNPSTRMFPFFRGMRYPQMSVVNNKLLIDGIFIRDHHGDDSTVFAAASNKNGQNPVSWTTPVSQGIPDKNDILDMFMHVRRDGPSINDSLWMFGGVSLDATTGNRYFDFEMYQTDITYNRSTRSFSGYGPNDGHTAWEFDASGNITKPGDVIFTAEYSSSSLTLLEARIWVDKAKLAVTPAAFSWGGLFDGAASGSTYGYANILPKTPGDFYAGMQCGNNTWAGSFGLVLQNNTVVTSYTARQFMEFSVNLSKLGLDHLSLSGDPCAMPFRRILVKSRSSTAFSAELKDFVGPFDFFRAPRANASASIPMFCGSSGYSTISVSNPLPTSLYTWSTTDGHIVSGDIGPTIDVDRAGTYVVSQELMDSCGSTYARDTVIVYQDMNCVLLKSFIKDFQSALKGNFVKLSWTVFNEAGTRFYEIERRDNSGKFVTIGRLNKSDHTKDPAYYYNDDIQYVTADIIYYRLKITDLNGNIEYSKTLAVDLSTSKISVKAVAAFSSMKPGLLITADKNTSALINIYTTSGVLMRSVTVSVNKGTSIIPLEINNETSGIYLLKVVIDNQVFSDKTLLLR